MEKTQGSRIKRGMEIVGEVFTARKSFPAKYGADKYNNEFIQDIRVNEHFKVLSYEEAIQTYTLLNLSLGGGEAWFKVNDEELDYLLRRGGTK